MRTLLCLLLLALISPAVEAQMAVGTNLSGCHDWGASQFHDVLCQQRTWLTRNADQSGDWDSGYSDEIPVDADGWPEEVPFSPQGALFRLFTPSFRFAEKALGSFMLKEPAGLPLRGAVGLRRKLSMSRVMLHIPLKCRTPEGNSAELDCSRFSKAMPQILFEI